MKAILAVLVVGMLLTGTVMAAPLVPFIPWAIFAGINLIVGTPAFASGWGDATATATYDPNAFTDKYPYTVTAVIVSDPTSAINTHKDPSATLNLTVVSVAGLGATTITQDAVSDGTQEWASYGASVGSSLTDVTAINDAWTVAAFATDATVDPTSSVSEASGVAAAIADAI